MRIRTLAAAIGMLAAFVCLTGCPPMPDPDDNANGNVNANANANDNDNGNGNGNDNAGNDNSGNDNNDGGSDPALEPFTDPKPVAARIVLPEGVGLTLADLQVSTIVDEQPVEPDGTAEVQIITAAPAFATVIGPGGKVVLLGFLAPDGSRGNLDSRSTAVALLFFALNGFGTPPERVADLLDAIDAAAATATLAAAIETALAANPTAITDGDPDLEAALRAAQQALLAGPAQPGGAPRLVQPAGRPRPAAAKAGTRQQSSDGLILLSPDANAIRSGVQVLQNDSGGGVIAQNNFRRRATLYAYLASTRSEGDAAATETNPPTLTGAPVEISGSERLSAFNAATSFVGTAPWTPVRSGPLALPLPGDVEEAGYKLVVLGPALSGVDGAAFDDPQLAPFRAAWNQKIKDLQFETAVWDFLMPGIEFLALGSASSIPVNARVASVAGLRAILDPRLAAAGIAIELAESQGFRDFMLLILRDIQNPALREGNRQLLTNLLTNLPARVQNTVTLQRLEARLVQAVAARTVLLAVELAFGALDGTAVTGDLTRSSRSELWQATVVERRVRLTPTSAAVSIDEPTAVFEASVVGRGNERFLYRWSTSGERGRIFDAFGAEGTAFDTRDERVQYVANPGAIVEGRMDTIAVEIFENNSLGVIPDGALAIGTATAVVNGAPDGGEPNAPDPGCDLLPIVTRPATPLFRIDIPETVRLGDRLEISITIDGPEIERLITGGRQSQVVTDILLVSGALGFVGTKNYEQILIDGAPIFSAGQNVGNLVTLAGEPQAHAGIRMDVGLFLAFDTRGPQTRTFSVPIDTRAECSTEKTNLVRVRIEPSRITVFPTPEQEMAFEQFAITE